MNKPLTIVEGKPRKMRSMGVKRTFKRSKPKKATKGRKVSITSLKKKLWAVTRLLVFKTYGTDCYTCDRKGLTGSNLQGGHVPWASSELSVTCRYDILYIRPQCYHCNINLSGRGATALLKMQSQGIDTAAMWALNLETKGRVQPAEFFEEKINHYKSLLTH